MTYVDVELLLVGWLSSLVPDGCRVCTDLPATLQDELPVVQVVRAPGGGDGTLTIDTAVVDVEVYAADRAGAVGLAEVVRGLLRLRLPGWFDGRATVLAVETSSPPIWRPYDDAARIRRFGATYVIKVQSAV